MIVDLGPLDGLALDRIEFLGVKPQKIKHKAIIA
jgi:hypothetical protein